MSGDEVRIAWWNTRLHGKDRGAPEVRFVADVLDELREVEGCAAIVACEVLPTLGADLAPSGFHLARSDLEHDDVVTWFDPARLRLSLARSLIARRAAHGYRAAALFDLQLPDGTSGLVAGCHWGAIGNRGDQDDVRDGHAASAAMLLHEVRPLLESSECPPVLLLGDFNEEPFGGALRLLATRDATRAVRAGDLFYNLAWRWLGSQRSRHPGDTGDRPAGTYLLRSGGASRWRTFDQALVSPSLLSTSGWSIDERNSRPLHLETLRGARGALLREWADHLPLVVTLRYTVPRRIEVEHDDAD